MQKQKLLITFWLLFVPVVEMFWETKFLMRSNASMINERMMVLIVLIVPPVSPPLIAVLLVRSEKAKTVSSVSQSMQVLSWL
eukprot:SAG31_NODE_1731_length_7420_cov_12.646914_4_plen_82_part_00